MHITDLDKKVCGGFVGEENNVVLEVVSLVVLRHGSPGSICLASWHWVISEFDR